MSAMAAQPRESMSVVSIRVHDYAQTDRGHLQQAAREVSCIYEHIGVRLDWREPGGRVAFVFGGRARDLALIGEVSQCTVLAGVMAHGRARLLNPRGTHSSDGVMRAHWPPSEFKHVNWQRFSDEEGSSVRQTVRALGGGPMRVAD